ncbi:MAG: protease complex subunit PrcB family protein [Rubrobacteraceae bacterium]
MPGETRQDPGRLALAVLAAVLFSLSSACGTGDGGGTSTDLETSQQPTTGTTSERTEPLSGEDQMLEIERIASGSSGQGEERPYAVVAPSLEALSRTLGGNLDLGRALRGAESTTGVADGGAYLAVFWGRKNTGGYAVEVEAARLEGERVIVELALKSPPEGAIVTQALTYPYAIARIEAPDPSNKEIVLVDQDGRELAWPVETAGD